MSCKLPIFLALLFCSNLAFAQHDLRRDQSFFRNRADDYGQWIESGELGRFFSVEKVWVTSDKVTLGLRSDFQGEKAGDSLRVAWRELRKAYYRDNRQELHVAMLSKMSFQMELPLDSTEIVIYAKTSSYKVRIYGEHADGMRIAARWEESGNKDMGSGNIQIPAGQLKDVFRSGNIQMTEKPGLDLPRIRKSVQSFFRENYLNKGTDWIWHARIDSTSDMYNEFSYTVTHISREVLKSHNFFEMHQINVRVEEGPNGLEIFWSFQAKYGGGLIFPPRNDSNDYHDFETSQYKDQFNKYQTSLFNRLKAQFQKV